MLLTLLMLVAAMVVPSAVCAEESTVTFTAKEGTKGFSDNENFDKLIDGKYTSEDFTKWCLSFSADNGAYIIFYASEPIVLNQYAIVTGNDNGISNGRNPKSWALYGCNDESAGRQSESWVLIDKVTDDTYLQDKNYKRYDYTILSNPPSEKYQYFKMEITATKGADVMQMSELIFTYSKCFHNWVKTENVVAPTCTDGGYDVYKCSVCNETKNEPNGEIALGHDWDEDDVCTRCGVKNNKPVGDGTPANPYKIETARNLYWFAALVNGDTSVEGVTAANKSACAKLTANIVVNEKVLNESGELNSGTFTEWTPMGYYSDPYSGIFDGDNHTISGLYFNNPKRMEAGLFGGSNGTIKNVGVVDSYFCGYDFVGGICGSNQGTVDNCYNKGSVKGQKTEGWTRVGGVCGSNFNDCTITNCYNTGNVYGETDGRSDSQEAHVGGVCGWNAGYIRKCYNTGNVNGNLETKEFGHYLFIGGVCGQSHGSIENCYNTGTIKRGPNDTDTKRVAGGICGKYASDCASIKNCFNIGALEPNESLEFECYIGGICGCFDFGAIDNCYFLRYDYGYGYNFEGIGEMIWEGSSVTNVKFKRPEQFYYGEVCYLLNNGVTDGTQAWYQKIGDDNYPTFTKNGTENTVYGGYEHHSDTPHCSNSKNDIIKEYSHVHAYDPDAEDEEHGFHDINLEGEYTWTDNEDKTAASVSATFTCSVCEFAYTPYLIVMHDDNFTNTPETCTEDGYNYYIAYWDETNKVFTDTYKQTRPALGHDMTETSFDEGKNIYFSQCQRSDCGHTEYYAKSDGSVKATENAGGFVVQEYILEDATPYDNKAVFTATDFTYNRTFDDTGWTTWYVPFDLVLTEELCNSYSFSRINNVHRYDDDDDGTPDRTDVEAFCQVAGVTLKANYPYLVKAKTDGDLNMALTLNSVVPALAKNNGCFCQSIDYKYEFTGTYSKMTEVGSGSEDPYSLQSNGEWTHQAEISPMRHYLTVSSRNAEAQSSLARIHLVIVGDETATGMVIPYSNEKRQTETYDLSGRMIDTNSRGIVIKNGKKIINN